MYYLPNTYVAPSRRLRDGQDLWAWCGSPIGHTRTVGIAMTNQSIVWFRRDLPVARPILPGRRLVRDADQVVAPLRHWTPGSWPQQANTGEPNSWLISTDLMRVCGNLEADFMSSEAIPPPLCPR